MITSSPDLSLPPKHTNILITLIIIFLLVFSGLHNVFCGAYETVVPVDPTGHEYYPFFVKLHRCAGSASTVSPNVQHCVAKTYDNIQVGSAIMMINHTSCAHACVASPDDCDSSVQVWNDSLCACKCRELICKDGFRYVSLKMKVILLFGLKKRIFGASWHNRPALDSDFYGMKQLGVLLLPRDGILVHRRLHPPLPTPTSILSPVPIYTWLKEGTVRITCLAHAKGHNTTTTARRRPLDPEFNALIIRSLRAPPRS